MKMSRKDNGDGSVYQRKDKRWAAQLQIGTKSNGRPNLVIKYTKTEAEAKRKLREIKKNRESEQAKSKGVITLEEYINEWFPRFKGYLKPSPYDRQENTIKYQIIPFIGSMQPQSITSSDVKDLMNTLRKEEEYAYSTVKKAYDSLNECLRQALDDDIIRKNPCNKYNKPKKAEFESVNIDDDEIKFLNDEEILKFTKSTLRKYSNNKMVYRLGYAFILMLNTGIRIGEGLAIRIDDDIDLTRRRIKIKSSMSFAKNRDKKENEKNYKYFEVTTKTKNSKRIVDLNDDAYEAVLKLIELNKNQNYLFSNSKGKLPTPRNIDKTFKSIINNAGIDNCGIHTFASKLFRSGVDIKYISEILGHASIQITYDTYIHLIEELKQEAITIPSMHKMNDLKVAG